MLSWFGYGTAKPSEGGRRVMIAVDTSSASSEVLSWATKNFLKPTDTLHLITVVEPVSNSQLMPGDHAIIAIGSPTEASVAAAELLLASRREEAEAAGMKDIRTGQVVCPAQGSNAVGFAIKDYATREDVDVVVLGNRGLGSIHKKLLSIVGLGSVSDYCARHIQCPIVIHKPKNHT